jgi:beta-glucosidase
MYFTRFVSYAAEKLGSLVKVWCTVNEPNVFANDTYMDGKYPPGHKGDIGAYFKTARTMIRAHAQCYDIIHRECARHRPSSETLVGFAHHIAVFEPYDASFFSRLGCRLQNYLFHTLFYKGFVEGKLAFPLGIGQRVRPKKQRPAHTARTAPSGTPDQGARTAAAEKRAVRSLLCDYIGINYYSRHLFKGTGRVSDLFAVPMVDPSVPAENLNDLGWEIYPEGLYQTVRSAWETYRLPVMITENGICDEADEKRAPFIADHLRQIVRLADENIPVLRYYHWSFLDNLEWNDGYGPRFGLTAVDYATMKRTVRPSGRYYAHICKTHTVSNPQEKYL